MERTTTTLVATLAVSLFLFVQLAVFFRTLSARHQPLSLNAVPPQQQQKRAFLLSPLLQQLSSTSAIASSAAAAASAAAPRFRASLNFGWRFRALPPGASAPAGWERPSYGSAAAAWARTDLPHDAALCCGTAPANASDGATPENGYLPCGTVLYRRTFRVPPAAAERKKQRRLALAFDGAQRNTRVWVDGVPLSAVHASGHTPWRVEIPSSVLLSSAVHTLAVLTDAGRGDDAAWWYEGCGLYRSVWLEATPPLLAVAPWGVHVLYEVLDPITAPGPTSPWWRANAALTPRVTVEGDTTQKPFLVSARAFDSRGRLVSEAWSEEASEAGTLELSMSIYGAALWSPATPELYTLEVAVLQGRAVVDEVRVTFGIRRVVFDAQRGLFLNGRHMLIKGTCNHQDFAGVGTAVPDNLQAFRVAKIKEMGANSWRTAHNPPTPALLDECDRLGLMVMDENFMNRADEQFEDDLRAMVLRDRNHPSVIMWSLCNEKLCNEWDAVTARRLKAVIRSLDPSRPVTAAVNGRFDSPFVSVLDVIGVNYHSKLYDQIHSRHPGVPIVASETASAFTDRGIYFADKSKAQLTAYDTGHTPWGDTSKDAWAAVVSRPYLAGAFVWTGFDYKGEPTPFVWPSVSSHFGAIDSAGFEKDTFHYYRNVWSVDRDLVHVMPHWNWFPSWGITIWTYSNGDQVEVLVNGKSIGKRFNNKLYYEAWDVEYAPGNVTAISYKAREVVATKTVVTTGKPRSVLLEVQRGMSFVANGQDVALVKASIVDKNGNVLPMASNRITFSVYGAGTIAGVGNGNPNDHSPDKANWRDAFNGRCMVLVRSIYGLPGDVIVSAHASGLLTGKVSMVSQPLTPSNPFYDSVPL